MPRKQKREFTTFNLSFLDVMSCGFGAVVLVFLIIDHSMAVHTEDLNRDLLSEVDLLEEEVTHGREGLVKLRNTLSDVDLQMVEAQGRATRITEDISEYEALIQSLRAEGYTEDADIEQLKAEIRSLEDEVKKLRESAPEDGGNSARTFVGEGNRQYLTGLNLGGRRIAILLDVSSSMLADRLVNIIRLRNMGEDVQRAADKWTRALNTVDWLTAQLPVSSDYQVITFNTQAAPALAGTEGKWLEVADQSQLEGVSAALRKIVPSGGTSLENAFIALQQLSPSPDNIFLITDGLPTQGTNPPRGTKVSGRERQKFYRDAVRQLPGGVPVNVILAPMEGDPMAASEFWQLAQVSQGSFLSPSKDWP
ncbi:vWA domain-containing protein [Pseudohalioglobus lutimaris]|uniref:VWA domain-containing protein n=1 Tax=Pseudohalioglobus lutimaris TaxID=1737061 RepID=A0A2N5X1J7_9GAMM|nr:vWA domain-containing protein [Pseudohalioglobus lutimaris]PLW68359.1 VWA domain-containing protein [Pseudohalioglobus lutimaris]